MYCPNCGNELNGDKFCTKCGYNTDKKEEASITNEAKVPTPKKTNKAGLVVVFAVVFFIFAVVIAVISLVFHFVFGLVDKYESKDYINIGDFKVSSVYKVLGEKKEICGISSNYHDNISTSKINYCNKLSKEEEEKYVEYLIEEEDFSLVDASYKYSLVKEVDGWFVVVNIDDNDNITYSCNDGEDAVIENKKVEM